jgi:hypothetical protein
MIVETITSTLISSGIAFLFGSIFGGPGGAAAASVAIGSRGGMPGRASGGPVSANQPYIVGDAPGGRITPYTEMFIPKTSGTIIPNSGLNNLMNTKGIEQRLDVLNMNLNVQSVNRRYDKLQIEGKTDIKNEAIRVSYKKAQSIRTRRS